MSRRALLVISLVALVHAVFFIWYQRPDSQVAWTDQGGYRQLGAVMARTGEFTRYPDYPVFVPEVIRTPGYPAFVALVYAVAGQGNDVAVAVAQAFVFAAICWLVYALARRTSIVLPASPPHHAQNAWRGPRPGGEGVAFGAALATALFAPLPYFGALVLTEVFATLVVTLAMFVCLGAAQEGRLRAYAQAGVLFSLATLVRPAFVLLPFFLAMGVPLVVPAHRSSRHLKGWAALALAAGLTLLPWFTYNYVYLGKFTLSPAGGIGRGLWEGAWQGRWPGRVQSELTAIADEPIETGELDRRVALVAARERLDPAAMLDYVHEWRDIRKIWEDPQDPLERTRARVVADQEYLRSALEHINEDPIGHVLRRASRGLFVLWAAEIPIRYTDINATSPLVIRAIWLVQVGLLVAAVAGLIALALHGRWLEAVLLGLPLVYVTGVHLPLLCEARQSLPVKPLVLAAAAIGVSAIRHSWHPTHSMHSRHPTNPRHSISPETEGS